MESVFKIRKSQCSSCTNLVLKSLGTLRGVYGGNVDTINGVITVSHTDEVSRKEIAHELSRLGFPETETPKTDDEPSIWGCAL
jgi:copper chaperone CopZ